MMVGWRMTYHEYETRSLNSSRIKVMYETEESLN